MVQLSDDQKITKRGNYHFDIPAIMQVINQMDDKVQLFNLKGKILHSFYAKNGFAMSFLKGNKLQCL